MELSTYLETDFSRQRQSVARVNNFTKQAQTTLENAQDKATGAWPYALDNRAEITIPDTFSESTTAMILHSVAASYAMIPKSVLAPAVQAPARIAAPIEIRSLLRKGMSSLIEKLDERKSLDKLTESKTWGDNDPLTLTWTYELARTTILKPAQTSTIVQRIANFAKDKISKIANDPASAYLQTGRTQYSVANPFLLLRYVHLAKTIDPTSILGLQLSKLPEALLAQFHTELSNSAIRDADFDPASLVFALEALMLLNTEAVSEAMIDRLVDVLSSTPSLGSHWRPIRPLAANSQGLIFLPQSVEVANSYLRICVLAMREFSEPLFSRSFGALQSYADWIISRAISVKPKYSDAALEAKAKFLTGWQSEHTYIRDTIHLWATSQVSLFLTHYSAMLDQHIARSSRLAAGLDFDPVSSKPRTKEDWEKEEPIRGLPDFSEFRVTTQVFRRFLAPRTDEASQQVPEFSILLYGPPGTGKTRFAKLMAESLEYSLIIVTPSDFIRTGESGVEARAKELFEVLYAQSRTVILFDEIDRLLLDRDSVQYETQADMFQFMTPSMLVKINDLRKKERSIFIIATNYAERIDNAIKRPGRIDLQVPLLPPGKAQREALIGVFATEYRDDQKVKNWNGDDGGSQKEPVLFDEDQVKEFARRTPLYTATELKQAVRSILDLLDSGRSFKNAIKATLKEQSPSISLESYQGRFYAKGSSTLVKPARRTPWKEFAMLAYICAEVELKLPVELAWVPKVLTQKVMKELGAEVLEMLSFYTEKNTK